MAAGQKSQRHDEGSGFSMTRQQYASWLTVILADIVVLNLFVEYVDKIVIDSFTITIFTAIVLRTLVVVTLQIEYRFAGFLKRWPGRVTTMIRIAVMWLILFGSKFVILEVVDVIFGDDVELGGFLMVIALITAMIVVEQVLWRIYASLKDSPAPTGVSSPG
jgi:hypothetical protein